MHRAAVPRHIVAATGAALGLVALDWRQTSKVGHCWSWPLSRSKDTEAGLLTLGLNPSQQTIVKLRNLDLGQVNRAEAALQGVGGKGQNAAKAAATLLASRPADARPSSGVTVAQFLGGDTGNIIQKHLDGLGINQITEKVSSSTRQTMTLLNYPPEKQTPTVTELVMPSEGLSTAEVKKLLAEVVSKVPKQKGILLMGTWPKGVDANFYAAVAKAKAKGAVVLMDAFKPVDEVATILSAGSVDCYKVNAYEICTLMGAKGLKEGQISADQVVDAIKQAFDKFPGVQSFAITDGASGAYFFGRDGEALRFEIPKVKCLNPIGAGDTVAGVMMAAFCSGLAPSLPEAMHMGLAAASAKVQSEGEGGVFDVAEMYRIKELITVQKVSKFQ